MVLGIDIILIVVGEIPACLQHGPLLKVQLDAAFHVERARDEHACRHDDAPAVPRRRVNRRLDRRCV